MEIKKLNEKQIIETYQKYIIDDFPVNERRPLEKIIYLYKSNHYQSYGLFDNDLMIGYAFFLGHEQQYICDYFAIIKEYRHQNYGSYFLKECLHLFQDAMLYFEVEEAEEPHKDTKQKRIQFYLKNGLMINHIKVLLFHVNYIILSNQIISTEKLQEFYHQIYDDEFYKRYIKFY